ncbi:MAG: hypothetical protein U1F35_00590 [Steroidobacteraceae bacterium]
MGFDIRLPIGLLFSIIGILLLLQGALTGVSDAAGSRGLPVNLAWGVVMLLFGAAALLLARRAGSAGNGSAGNGSAGDARR